MIHSFLLIGQSNAAGRGFLNEAPALNNLNERIKIQRNGKWRDLFRPVNPDRGFSGYCFAESFAVKYGENNPDVEIGIIPCADGGTGLSQWQQGEALFDNAVNCAKLAMRESKLVGILWHQGEGDCSIWDSTTYASRFKTMIEALKKELNLPEIPVIVGGLGDFLVQNPDPARCEKFKDYNKVNQALQRIATKEKNVGFVSAEGLVDNSDYLHFSAQSLRIFGVRYYRAFLELEDKNRIFEEKTTVDAGIKTGLENL